MDTKSPLKIITNKEEMKKWSCHSRSQGKLITLVPTMGFLHKCHLSLIKQAHTHADVVMVLIYVNPSQFSTSEDLSTYPSDFSGDIERIMSVPGAGGADVVFNPKDLYDYDRSSGMEKRGNGVEGEKVVVSCMEKDGSGNGHESWIRVEKLEKGLCGKSISLFFRGVTTIVAKLFNIVEPDVTFFRKRDYKQWRVIQRMVRDLDFAVEVIGSKIIYEENGLAMSSRNVYLSPEERQKAVSIYRSLSAAKSTVKGGQTSCKELKDSIVQLIEEDGGIVDYAEIVDQKSLELVEMIKRPVAFCVAARFGKARLIDNMEINLRKLKKLGKKKLHKSDDLLLQFSGHFKD